MQLTSASFFKQVDHYCVHTFPAVDFFKQMHQELIDNHPDAEEYATPVDETDTRTIVYMVDNTNTDQFVWTAVDQLSDITESLITTLQLDLLHFMEEDSLI